MKTDQERVRNLLTDTVTLLCKNGLQFNKEIKVQGLLGITVDQSEVFLVPFDQTLTSLIAQVSGSGDSEKNDNIQSHQQFVAVDSLTFNRQKSSRHTGKLMARSLPVSRFSRETSLLRSRRTQQLQSMQHIQRHSKRVGSRSATASQEVGTAQGFLEPCDNLQSALVSDNKRVSIKMEDDDVVIVEQQPNRDLMDNCRAMLDQYLKEASMVKSSMAQDIISSFSVASFAGLDGGTAAAVGGANEGIAYVGGQAIHCQANDDRIGGGLALQDLSSSSSAQQFASITNHSTSLVSTLDSYWFNATMNECLCRLSTLCKTLICIGFFR